MLKVTIENQKAAPRLRRSAAGLLPRKSTCNPTLLHVRYVVNKVGTGTGVSATTSVSLCHHCSNASYSFICRQHLIILAIESVHKSYNQNIQKDKLYKRRIHCIGFQEGRYKWVREWVKLIIYTVCVGHLRKCCSPFTVIYFKILVIFNDNLLCSFPIFQIIQTILFKLRCCYLIQLSHTSSFVCKILPAFSRIVF